MARRLAHYRRAKPGMHARCCSACDVLKAQIQIHLKRRILARAARITDDVAHLLLRTGAWRNTALNSVMPIRYVNVKHRMDILSYFDNCLGQLKTDFKTFRFVIGCLEFLYDLALLFTARGGPGASDRI